MSKRAYNTLFSLYLSVIPGLFSQALLLSLLMIGCFCQNLSLFAQNSPHPYFRQYTTNEGLASSEIFYILQDFEGFIWIASDNGVSRFDGYEFRNYGLKDGLLENVIFEMRLDSLGRVWMQAMSGNLYYLVEDKIHPYWNNEVLLDFNDRPDHGKGFLIEGAGEVVHIATLKYGVISISKEGRARTYIQNESIYSQVFEKNQNAIYAICDQGKKNSLQADGDKKPEQKRHSPVYFHTNKKLWSIPDLFYTKKEVKPAETFRLDEGKYLFQLFNDVWLIENGEVRWQHYFPYHIQYACLMDKGQLFVGLNGHRGLQVYKSIAAFRKEEASVWLPGKSINHFMEDRDGGWWIATHEDGVFYAPTKVFMIHDREAGLSDEKVTALAIKNEKEGFAGLENGEVWSFNQRMEKWKKLPTPPGKGSLKTLHFDSQNQELWAGRRKLYFLKKNSWQIAKEPYQSEFFTVANRITESPGGERLWLCNSKGFMSIELPKKNPDNIHIGFDQRTHVVREDFTGKVWVGQPQGLFEWKDGILEERQGLHPAFSLRIEDLALLPDSSLVIATKGGGIVFWKREQFEQITTQEGLTADMMECLYADEPGIVWGGTLNGLNRITGTWGKREVEQITFSHGLPSNEINSIKVHNGIAWVATNKGLVSFSRKNKSQFSPQPILTNILSNNHLVDLAKPLRFKYKENNLAINFFAINYKINGQINYRYRIDGREWVFTQNRSLNFPALPPGERLVEVQAQNEDRVWSESTTLEFVINYPWWDTLWAKSLAFLASISFVLAVYKYRMGQLRKANKLQRQITELERSALQAQMNPHFIFNCLNSIQNYILQNKKEAAIFYLGSFANLVRSILNASVTGKISLWEEEKLLNYYLELEKLRFKNRFSYEVKMADDLNVFEVEIPPLLVQPYVENAVKHGISGRTNGGKVAVFFEKKGDHIEVVIVDNGVGFPSESSNQEKSKSHKSFGMSITRNRLELLSKEKEGKAVNLETLYDGLGQIAGTKVSIRIDLTEENLTNKS